MVGSFAFESFWIICPFYSYFVHFFLEIKISFNKIARKFNPERWCILKGTDVQKTIRYQYDETKLSIKIKPKTAAYFPQKKRITLIHFRGIQNGLFWLSFYSNYSSPQITHLNCALHKFQLISRINGQELRHLLRKKPITPQWFMCKILTICSLSRPI